jgi:CRP-like cAMP-binding protein
VLGALVPVVVLGVAPMLRRVDDGVSVPWWAVECLKGSSVFTRLSVRDCETLAATAIRRDLDEGVQVIVEGDHGDACYLIIDGSVAVSRASNQVAVLEAGGYFGEIALLRDIPRTATVTTLEPTRLLEVDRDDFLAVVGDNRVAASSVEEDTDRRLGELDELD